MYKLSADSDDIWRYFHYLQIMKILAEPVFLKYKMSTTLSITFIGRYNLLSADMLFSLPTLMSMRCSCEILQVKETADD